MIGIYKISNTINDKIYIGSSLNITKRWCKHKSSLKSQNHCNPKLQNFYNKYSKDALVFEIIEECSEEILLEKEQWYLDNVINWENDFNLSKTVNAVMERRKHTSKTIEILRQCSTGKKHSEESKLLMSKASKGRFHTDSSKQKLRDKQTGKKMSMEAIEKNRQNKLGLKHSQETKDKLSKKLNQYDLNGVYIKTWNSAKEVVKELGVHPKSKIGLSAGGFQWRHYKGNVDNINPHTNRKRKRVAQITEFGEVIKVYSSIGVAAKDLNLNPASIGEVCRKIYNSIHGYKFKYAD